MPGTGKKPPALGDRVQYTEWRDAYAPVSTVGGVMEYATWCDREAAKLGKLGRSMEVQGNAASGKVALFGPEVR